jgi:signal transduction histidine kinase
MNSDENDFYTDLISVVAHDLKTPVSAVKGFIELVQQAGPLNKQQEHFSERALASLEKMERLIADLLEYTRINAGLQFDPVECDLREMIAEAVEMLEEAAGRRQVTISVDVQSEAPLVKADVGLMAEVLNNLLSNAVKYNRDGGVVRVAIADDENQVRVEVHDTGVGIPPDDVERVFERFYRSRSNPGMKVEGSGLGLAIVETIIKRHSGRIWVTSTEGEGSVFSFVLPGLNTSSDSDQPQPGAVDAILPDDAG